MNKGDEIRLNDKGLERAFDRRNVKALQHMKTLPIRVLYASSGDKSHAFITDRDEINALSLTPDCFDLTKDSADELMRQREYAEYAGIARHRGVLYQPLAVWQQASEVERELLVSVMLVDAPVAACADSRAGVW